jgi:hypothetical protein
MAGYIVLHISHGGQGYAHTSMWHDGASYL